MLDSHSLTEREKQIAYLLKGVTEDEMKELAKLGLLLHVIYTESMTTQAKHSFEDVLRSIGPEFLLTFRALRATARHIVYTRRNWRQRT